DLRLGGLVAEARGLVGSVAFDLALDVGHGSTRSAREPGQPTSPQVPRTMRAGTPTAVAPAGTSVTTTALAPMRAPSPTVTAPRILAPAPMNTSSPITGRRSPR